MLEIHNASQKNNKFALEQYILSLDIFIRPIDKIMNDIANHVV